MLLAVVTPMLDGDVVLLDMFSKIPVNGKYFCDNHRQEKKFHSAISLFLFLNFKLCI